MAEYDGYSKINYMVRCYTTVDTSLPWQPNLVSLYVADFHWSDIDGDLLGLLGTLHDQG